MVRYVIIMVWIGAAYLLSPSAYAQDLGACPEALEPRLTIGETARVTPGDANNMRETPSRQGTRVGEIAGGGVFMVLDGPRCADGLIWWQVDYQGMMGWTVEGANGEYWLEPYTPPATATPAPPTPTPSPTPTALPAMRFEPLRPVVNVLAEGVQARVVDDWPDGTRFALTIRTEPTRSSTPDGEVVAGDIVTILSDAVEADSFFWRQIQTATGKRGWIVEGFYHADANRYDRTLIAACPATENRIAFFIERHIFTSNSDGSELCVFDRLYVPGWYTFNPGLADITNGFFWSSDQSEVYFVNQATAADWGAHELFAMSADGLTRRQVTKGTDVAWLNWSPDGSRLLLAQTVAGSTTPQIWTMRANGNAYGTISRGEDKAEWGAWLADNQTLVYIETTGDEPNQIGPTEQVATIYRVNVQQGGETVLYRTERELVYISISPDRSTILVGSWGIQFHEDYPYGERTDFERLLIDTTTGETTVIEGSEYGYRWLPDSSGLFTLLDESILIYNIADRTTESIALSDLIPADFYLYDGGFIDEQRLLLISDGPSYATPDDDLILSLNVETGEVETLVGPKP